MSLEEEARAANAAVWEFGPSQRQEEEEVDLAAEEVRSDRQMTEAGEEEEYEPTTDGGDHTGGDGVGEDDGSGNPAAKKKKKPRKDRKPTVLANTTSEITLIMSYPNFFVNFCSFVHNEELKVDGSNFIDWCQRLRDVLISNDLLYVIEEPLGDEPKDSTSEDDKDDYRTRRDLFIVVKCDMLHSMVYELRVWFDNTNAYDMVDALNALFISLVRVMKYECLDEFLSTKMEENTCLESHLANMHRIHGRLVHDWDY
ncbi:hypothetical protein ACQ4PT_000508 [Festuca glaucescens]